jgi:TorA maturation chaperone TorD
MTESPLKALSFASADDSEELARAELYGLLSGLWHAPPDEAMLAQFGVAVTQAPEPGSFLEAPWAELVAAMRATTPEQAAAEHEALFHGVGKPEVFAYASYYLSGFLNERPLAALRDDLARLGLTRDAQSLETEDHIAYVLEVMRWLIAGDDVALCNLEQQRRFFRAHLQPWVSQLCDAVLAQPPAATWRAVANFTAAFIEVETQAFDLLES